jgi:hypothetical protein
MANEFKVMERLTKFAVKDFLNSLQLGAKIDRQLDESNVFGGDSGATAKIRRPVRVVSTSGAEITSGQITDIEEGTIPFTLNQRRKTAIGITTQDLTLSVEYLRERYIQPKMYELAQYVESYIAEQYKYVSNFIGTAGVPPSSFLDVANAKAKLNLLGVPMDQNRSAFYGPLETVNLSDGLKGVFVQEKAKRALDRATFGYYSGFDCYENQSLALHTVGVNTGTPLVNGADQNTTYALSKDSWTQTLNTDGWTNSQTGILKAGDVFTIADVYAVNRRTRASTQQLAQFTVTADADSGAATGPAALTISPPIIISGPYQTVTAAPANNAAITVQTGTGGTSYRQNLAFHKNAFTMAMVPLAKPDEGTMATQESYDGVSIRMIKKYDVTLDKVIWRCDILFDVKAQNPDWAVRTTG